MSGPLKCLLDLDGVLSDFNRGACELHRVENPYLNPANAGKYGIEHLVGLYPEVFYSGMNEEFWANLWPTPEFHRVLLMVEKKFGAENVCLLTAPIETHGCLEGKRRWIREHLPQYRRRFLIGAPKQFCAGPSSILIDDSDKNVKEFRKEGGRTILYPRPWNAFHHFSKNPTWYLEYCLENL